MKRRFYIATRFRNRDYGLEVARNLEAKYDMICTARWLVRSEKVDSSRDDKNAYATEDLDDIRRAQILIVLTEQCEAVPGGMWVEMGFALALNKRVIICGPIINIFCGLCPVVDEVFHLENALAATYKEDYSIWHCLY